MQVHVFDLIGLTGVTIILLAYFLLQAQKIEAVNWRYSMLNLIGAALITISLIVDFNLSALVIELAWMAISIYGLVRYKTQKNSALNHNVKD